MIYRSQANCSMCIHYQADRRCQAFPEGIPQALWTGEHLHRDSYPGDGGIRYQPKQIASPILEDIFPEAVVDQSPSVKAA
ncbi:MAG TPA: hypothetical protein PK959_05710 [Candidatus Competibacteraceae bacterium]|nr:hypothetical protein [Candidatus Competibacteraceae bacterium]HSA45234.1 hypothetical protein [Candidatus Competibacteraceae bacterium]